MKKIIQILFVAIIAVSCNLTQTSDTDNAIARVYDDYLYSSELNDIISTLQGFGVRITGAEQSIQGFIDFEQWARGEIAQIWRDMPGVLSAP